MRRIIRFIGLVILCVVIYGAWSAMKDSKSRLSTPTAENVSASAVKNEAVAPRTETFTPLTPSPVESKQSAPDVDGAQARVNDAEKVLETSNVQVMERAKADPTAKKLEAEIATAEADLIAKRKGDDIQAQLTASSRFNKLRAAYAEVIQRLLAKDTSAAPAEKSLREAQEHLAQELDRQKTIVENAQQEAARAQRIEEQEQKLRRSMEPVTMRDFNAISIGDPMKRVAEILQKRGKIIKETSSYMIIQWDNGLFGGSLTLTFGGDGRVAAKAQSGL